MIVCIGDVHGKTHIYQKMIRQKYENCKSVQLGDMGIGFPGVGLHQMPPQHGWIRGNHDNPELCQKKTNYLGDYGFISDGAHRGMYIGGAYSIDASWRTPQVDWWSGEELSGPVLEHIIGLYKLTRPEFVLSHECPSQAAQFLVKGLLIDPYYQAKSLCQGSRTAQAMQVMFDYHQPKEWVFGHYHIDESFELMGTKFTCVNELSTYELDLA